MQLTKPSNLHKESVIFRKAKTDKHGNEIIKIQTKYDDSQRLGPLVIETPFLFSFGVNERKSLDSGETVGYTLPVCLWEKDEEPTPEQRSFFDCLSLIQEVCHEHLEETYEERDASERLSEILYYKTTTDKKGRKKRDESFPPVLYQKLIYSGKTESILSLFRTKNDTQGVDNVDPMLYFEKYCTVKTALIIDSIYISESSVSIQTRVSECYVKPQAFSIKPLLTIRDSDSDEETE